IFIHSTAPVTAGGGKFPDDFHFFYSDIPGGERMESAPDPVLVEFFRAEKIGYLPQRVHAGIGPPGSGNTSWLPHKSGNSFLQKRMNGFPAGLDLPAMVVGPVVLDGKFDVHGKELRSDPILAPPRGNRESGSLRFARR